MAHMTVAVFLAGGAPIVDAVTTPRPYVNRLDPEITEGAPARVEGYRGVESEGVVTPSFAPIRGSARIELSDIVGLALFSQIKRFTLYLLFRAVIIGVLLWTVCDSLAPTGGSLGS